MYMLSGFPAGRGIIGTQKMPRGIFPNMIGNVHYFSRISSENSYCNDRCEVTQGSPNVY